MLPFLCTSFTSPRNLGYKLHSFTFLLLSWPNLSNPYSSCTFKAITTPRRALFHSPIASASLSLLWFKKNTWKCHHLVSWAFGSSRWVAWSFNFSSSLFHLCHFNSLLVLLFLYFKLFLVCLWKIQPKHNCSIDLEQILCSLW